MKKIITNPISGKKILDFNPYMAKGRQPISEIVEHFFPNTSYVVPKKKPSKVPYYYKNVYKC